MCLSIPKRVVEWEGEGEFAGDFAWVERDGQRERVNMMLIGPQPVGDGLANPHPAAGDKGDFPGKAAHLTGFPPFTSTTVPTM